MSFRMASVYAQELEQDPFDPEEFVDRLAWRLTNGERADPVELHHSFEQEIQNLQMFSDQCQSKINRLQNQVDEEREEYYVTLERLQDENQAAFEQLESLNEKMNTIAIKVVSLGDQLQNADAPRSRAFEALKLMRHFNEFLVDQPLESDVFTDPDRLLDAADVINKLYVISQELVTETSSDTANPEKQVDLKRMEVAISQISRKYDEIEKALIEDFITKYRMGNKAKMKQIAEIMSHFKNYSDCLNAFIDTCQIGVYKSPNVFNDVLNLCDHMYPLIMEVFPSPEQVMAQLICKIFCDKLQEEVKGNLILPTPNSTKNELESFLTRLYDMYSKTLKLTTELSKYQTGKDKDFLKTLTNQLFHDYLPIYSVTETRYLKEQCSFILQKYYEVTKKHTKKTIQGGGFQEMRRDLTARIMPETYGGETFLSEEVSIGMLQETRYAFQRCELLSGSSSLAVSENAEKVLDILIQSLCQEHIDYAIELALYGIPLSEPKTIPELQFLQVVRQVNDICHLFEKQFTDNLLPIVSGTSLYESCTTKKRTAMASLESKLSNGLDRLLNAIVGYARYVLTTEQKKTDFRPESEDVAIPLCTTACSSVVRFLSMIIDKLQISLDGDNLESCKSELGIRFHRALVDHIYSFPFTSAGAMLLICDVNEYRKCMSTLDVPFVKKLFETLHSLCNLLLVAPDNLAQTCTADLLGEVDMSVVSTFVQLRTDYKTAKLNNDFK